MIDARCSMLDVLVLGGDFVGFLRCRVHNSPLRIHRLGVSPAIPPVNLARTNPVATVPRARICKALSEEGGRGIDGQQALLDWGWSWMVPAG